MIRLAEPSVHLIHPRLPTQMEDLIDETADQILRRIECAGRTCYKSEDRIDKDSSSKFIEMIIRRGHESVLEHGFATVRIVCDRGVSHEIVRHRIASYSQESTRYVNYGNRGVQVVSPESAFPNHMPRGSEMLATWQNAMTAMHDAYNKMLELGAPPELARSVLANSTKTEIVMTANLREWRHFCKIRCDAKAHPQMREIAHQALALLKQAFPPVFQDMGA